MVLWGWKSMALFVRMDTVCLVSSAEYKQKLYLFTRKLHTHPNFVIWGGLQCVQSICGHRALSQMLPNLEVLSYSCIVPQCFLSKGCLGLWNFLNMGYSDHSNHRSLFCALQCKQTSAGPQKEKATHCGLWKAKYILSPLMCALLGVADGTDRLIW